MLLNGFARLGATDLESLESMSFREFNIRMEAYMLKRIDEKELISFNAWQNRAIEATKKRGKREEYVVKEFKDLYDREKEEQQFFNKKKQEKIKKNKPSQRALDMIKNINN